MHNPTNSVRIVLFDKDFKSFTALTETDDPDNLKLPGGKFEPGESADDAAARELVEEVGLEPQEVGLTFAGELTNDDGVSKRNIYVGKAGENMIKPSEEIHRIGSFSEDTLTEGKNRGHILSAVALARSATLKS